MSLEQQRKRLLRRHLREGWATLLVFVLLGLALEILLAWKWGPYVRADMETRRLMWRLAHAHGTLFALLHFALAFTFAQLPLSAFTQRASWLSQLLRWAGWLIAGGFFFSGLDVDGGDPGIAIALVPIGAVFLISACALGFSLFKKED